MTFEIQVFILITALIFTYVGRWMERKRFAGDTSKIIEATIDRLIKDSYVKSKLDKNGEVELMKYYEE